MCVSVAIVPQVNNRVCKAEETEKKQSKSVSRKLSNIFMVVGSTLEHMQHVYVCTNISEFRKFPILVRRMALRYSCGDSNSMLLR